ncbi:hypothetical protein Sros01_78440 [Streptomyces roseochromogenus]|nr:hypothetical protein Sros01_78440 [Streptomyces roseochromogenus]
MGLSVSGPAWSCPGGWGSRGSVGSVTFGSSGAGLPGAVPGFARFPDVDLAVVVFLAAAVVAFFWAIFGVSLCGFPGP